MHRVESLVQTLERRNAVRPVNAVATQPQHRDRYCDRDDDHTTKSTSTSNNQGYNKRLRQPGVKECEL
ncbi:MAG: hypothetical protein M1826_002330 [Phylliscum demangeonii]|nr:MAG: hypothetical protein M1826_002330 [Phylliscum demangeonii]